MTKFCSDCKYREKRNNEFAKCFHQEAYRLSLNYLVTGKDSRDLFLYATSMRGYICGAAAKFFEPKEPKKPTFLERMYKKIFKGHTPCINKMCISIM